MERIKINVFESHRETNHAGTVNVVRLLRPNESIGEISTMNYAWLDPGKELDPHRHSDGIEYYLFLQGQGEMLIEDNWFDVQPGDFITIALNALHSLRNNTDTELEFVTLRTFDNTR